VNGGGGGGVETPNKTFGGEAGRRTTRGERGRLTVRVLGTALKAGRGTKTYKKGHKENRGLTNCLD